MMTPEDIRNVEFTKGRGYRAEEVDDFIDTCVGMVEQLIQENAAANQKIKVLADQVAEYRNDEDNIRAALLSAQRTGDTILREAQTKAKELLDDANNHAEIVRRELMAQTEAEQRELERVKQEAAAFKEKLLDLYKDHLAVIRLLPEQSDEPTAPVEEPTEEVTAYGATEAPVDTPDEEDDEATVVVPITEETFQGDSHTEMKPMSRFADLKFGNDYDIHEEEDDNEGTRSRGLFRKKK